MKQKNEKRMILIKNSKGETFTIPTKRALVLQGGGALGYYEIGVLESIFKNIFNIQKPLEESDGNTTKGVHLTQTNQINDKINERKNNHFFDIIAGVSIGAINAVFLVDYVLKNNGKWEEAPSELKAFWDKFRANTFADSSLFRLMWDGFRFFNPNVATTEAARRYWSFYQLACSMQPFGGTSPNLCNSILQFDHKYFSPFNTFFSYDYQPLMRLMETNIDYPIKTDFETNQPRLLLLSVDVKDCSTAVTFDSCRTYKSICDVCGQHLEETRLLANHIREHINEISKNNENINLANMSKSIPITKGNNEDPNNSSDERIWTTVYGDDASGDRKHVVSFNGIDNDILMTSCLFPYSNHHTILYDLI